MSTDMDWIRIIEARTCAATAGPWVSFVEGRDFSSGSSFIRTHAGDIELIGAKVADQDFIAHARQDVLLLIQEIRRLAMLADVPGP